MPLGTLAALTPEEAVARGHDVFDVTLVQWGMTISDSYPIASATGTKGFPITPQAVMIGPRSTVDRCWVSWNTQRPIPGTPMYLTRELSVDSPLFFAMPANERGVLTTAPTSLITDAQDKNMLMFFPTTPISFAPMLDAPPGIRSTVTPATYAKADGTVVAFGPDNISRPVLELRFFLKPGFCIPSTKRMPFFDWGTYNGLPVAVGVEYAAGYIPTFGRKNIVLQATSNKVGTTVRVAALRNANPDKPLQETTEGLKTTVAVNESLRFQFCDPAADWIIIYAAKTDVNADFTFNIVAYD